MGVSALNQSQTVKISSKRQITIPSKFYEAGGFDEYALCTWTENGLLLQPLKVNDEDNSVTILRQLVAEGYEGDELVDKYEEIQNKIVSIKHKLQKAEYDIAEGRVGPVGEMFESVRKQYGLEPYQD